MDAVKVSIEKRGGKITPLHQQILREVVNQLPEGPSYWTIEPDNSGPNVSFTRYKYYFGCLLPLWLPTAGMVYGYVENDEFVGVRTTAELHSHLKRKYNGKIAHNSITGKTTIVADSTLNMSDREFITKYQEAVIQEMCDHPFYLTDIPTREEWKEMHKQGQWRQFIKEYKYSWTSV